MGVAKTAFIQQQVSEEIRRIVAEAVSSGGTISTADCVTQIMAIYPNCGVSKRQLANEVMMAASAAGIAVEMDWRARASS